MPRQRNGLANAASTTGGRTTGGVRAVPRWLPSKGTTLLWWPFVFLLMVFVALFVAVMVHASVAGDLGRLLGLSEKNEILSFIGIGMGGVLVALQAVASYRRAKAMEDTARAQASAAEAHAVANANTERGQRQERLKNAIEHLGSESDSVRLGGAYELLHLAKDSPDLAKTVLDILCAHIRRTTRSDDYQKGHKSEPSEEIQSLLTLLFVEEHRLFEKHRANLERSYLNGVKLPDAHLARASLRHVQLREAHLWAGQLRRVDCYSANLSQAILLNADLQGAMFSYASLQGASLRGANMRGASLLLVRLQNADLVGAHLQGAILPRARLQGADLSGARLQGASLQFAQLHHAKLNRAVLLGVDSSDRPLSFNPVKRIQDRIGQEADFSTVTFSGGLSPDDPANLVVGLDPDAATILRTLLESDVGKPATRRPPADVVTGAYTETDADGWITELKQVLSEPD